jgi:hypothetical protein
MCVVFGKNFKIQKLFKVKNFKFVDINKPHYHSTVPINVIDMSMLMYFTNVYSLIQILSSQSIFHFVEINRVFLKKQSDIIFWSLFYHEYDP